MANGWKDYEQLSSPLDEFSQKLEKIIVADVQIENAKETIKSLDKVRSELEQDVLAKLSAGVIPDNGIIEHEGFVIKVTTKPQRMSWDTDILASLTGLDASPIPPFMKLSLTIPKKEWEKLNPKEMGPFLPALEVKGGEYVIEVYRKGSNSVSAT